MKLKTLYFSVLFLLLRNVSFGCQCPVTTLSLAECNKYEIIFKGKIDSVRTCNQNFGEAFFTVEELYKGNLTKAFKILFECEVPCAMQFSAGEEWVIYTNFKQIGNGKMDWCSRSRKYFKIEKQDYYTVNYGNDYDDEVKFLRDNFGLHRTMSEVKNASENRNERPDTKQMIIYLCISLGAIILFYWLFNKFFKF